MGKQPPDEGFGLGFSQTVEKEMGRDQIVSVCGRRKAASVGTEGRQPTLCVLTCGSTAQQAQHGRAGIHRLGRNLRTGCEEPREKAAVAVAENQRFCTVPGGQSSQVMETAALQHRSERQVFRDAVETRHAIKARWLIRYRHSTTTSKGVSRAASAAILKRSSQRVASSGSASSADRRRCR